MFKPNESDTTAIGGTGAAMPVSQSQLSPGDIAAQVPAPTGLRDAIVRLSLELPVGEAKRVRAYAADKGVTVKYVMQRALLMYFAKVNEIEGNKYTIQATDNRDIL